MSFIELKKRRSARRLTEVFLAVPADESHAEHVTFEPIAPEEAPVEAPMIQAVLEAPAPSGAAASAVVMDTGLLAPVLHFLQRTQEVVVLGLGPWGEREWAEGLMVKSRGVTMVDPDKSRLNGVRAYCHHTVTTGFENPAWPSRLGQARYDVALIGQALTHLSDPLGFLRQVKDILSPGGAVLAVVPNVGYGEAALNLLKGEYPRDFEPHAPIHHYTRARLRELFAFAGYTVVDVYAYEQAIFSPGSELVPELFPEALLTAIQQEDDFSASHFVVKAVPATQEALLRELFEDQERLRKTMRNEVARIARTHDALTTRLKESDQELEQMRYELEGARRNLTAMHETAQRSEHNVRRLTKEAEDANAALNTIKASFAYQLYRLFNVFGKKPKPIVAPQMTGPEVWKYDG